MDINNKILIREFKQEDRTQIEEIILRAENFGIPFLDDEKKKIMFSQKIPSHFKVFVAEDCSKKSILGYISFEIKWKSIAILAIVVHHNHLRKGVGSQLIEKVKEWSRQLPNIDIIRVDTGDFMMYAQKFYLSCGFQIAGYVSHDLSLYNHQVHFFLPLKGG